MGVGIGVAATVVYLTNRSIVPRIYPGSPRRCGVRSKSFLCNIKAA